MPLTREHKEDLVAEYYDLLDQSKAVILTEYRGLTNKEMMSLRRSVREAGGVYRVAKLTLLKKALEQTGFMVPEDLSGGTPIAVGFCLDEIPSVAKALTEFAKESELLSIRGGIMPEEFLGKEQVKAMAELPPLDVLRAQLIGLLDAPASNLVGVLQAGIAQTVNVINAYIDAGGPAEAAPAAAEAEPVEAEAPAEEPVEAEAPAEEPEAEAPAEEPEAEAEPVEAEVPAEEPEAEAEPVEDEATDEAPADEEQAD